MKEGNFSGFDNLQLEDFVMQVSMGAIADRTNEQLCIGDQVIVRARRLYLQMAREFQRGKSDALPARAADDLRQVRSWSFLAATESASRWTDPQLRSAAAVS